MCLLFGERVRPCLHSPYCLILVSYRGYYYSRSIFLLSLLVANVAYSDRGVTFYYLLIFLFYFIYFCIIYNNYPYLATLLVVISIIAILLYYVAYWGRDATMYSRLLSFYFPILLWLLLYA